MHLTYVNKRERSRRWYIPRYKSTVSNRTFHVAAQYLNVVEPLAVARILTPELRVSLRHRTDPCKTADPCVHPHPYGHAAPFS